MTTAVPVFRVFDYAKVIEFYVNWLGFSIDWEYAPEQSPFYMQVSLREVRINLSEHHGECSPGALVLITGFKGLRAYQKSLLQKKYTYMRPGLETREWDPGTIFMGVIDPFYNRLQFEEKNG